MKKTNWLLTAVLTGMMFMAGSLGLKAAELGAMEDSAGVCTIACSQVCGCMDCDCYCNCWCGMCGC